MRRLAALPLLIAAALTLAGCQEWMDSFDNWFTSAHKSNLRGERISLLGSDETMAPDPALAHTRVLLPRPYRNPDWPQPGGYPTNAMYHLDAPGPLKEQWTADAGKGSDGDSRLTAEPVVGGGRIFALDSEAHIYAFDARTGEGLWNKRLAPKNGTDMPTLWGLLGKHNTIDPPSGMGGGVAYHDGKVFVTSGFGVAYALDARTGAFIWGHDFGVPILNAPVVVDGRLFVSTADNHFWCLAESDGRELWDHQGIAESATIMTSTSVAVAGDTVIVPYSSGELYALRMQNGQVAWSDVLSRSGQVTALSELDDIAGRPVVDRGVVYAISHSGVMAAIKLSSGDRIWSRNVGGIETPWTAGDYVYVVTPNGKLLCLTGKDGKVRWVHQLPQWEDAVNNEHPINWSGPVLVSNKLILVSSDGYAEAISPYDGHMMGRIDLEDGASVAPIVANGTMYVYTDDGTLAAYR